MPAAAIDFSLLFVLQKYANDGVPNGRRRLGIDSQKETAIAKPVRSLHWDIYGPAHKAT